jgi:hypothetical protein
MSGENVWRECLASPSGVCLCTNARQTLRSHVGGRAANGEGIFALHFADDFATRWSACAERVLEGLERLSADRCSLYNPMTLRKARIVRDPRAVLRTAGRVGEELVPTCAIGSFDGTT